MVDNRYYTAQEAARELDIALSTLYSYVSRGLIRSEAAAGSKRSRRYNAEDVRRLKQRKEQRRNPAQVVAQALHWGAPLLESSLTLIRQERLYYRGHDVMQLTKERSIEEVAALLWTDGFESSGLFGEEREAAVDPEILQPRLAELRPVEAFQALLPLAAATDWAAYDLRPRTVARIGARILRLLTRVAAGGSPDPGGVAATLQQGWLPDEPGAVRLFDAALILCADHELNVSSFTARCVASAGSTPYGVVIAGLAALQGRKHGGHTERVDALLREVDAPERSRTVLAARLRRGESIPGFGHKLYPTGDPRGRLLLALAEEARPQAAAVARAAAVAAAAEELIEQKPTIDFGLATLAAALDLPPGAALTLFALGRTVGWIGHAIEQYESDRLIRPRARYVGRQPREQDGS